MSDKCMRNECSNEASFMIRLRKKGWSGGTGSGIMMGLKLCTKCALNCEPKDVVAPESFPIIQRAMAITGMKVVSIDDLEVFPVDLLSEEAKRFTRLSSSAGRRPK